MLSYFSGNETETVVKSQAPYFQAGWKIVMCKFKNFNLQGEKNSNQVQTIIDSLTFVAFSHFEIYVRSGTPSTEIRKNEVDNTRCDW